MELTVEDQGRLKGYARRVLELRKGVRLYKSFTSGFDALLPVITDHDKEEQKTRYVDELRWLLGDDGGDFRRIRWILEDKQRSAFTLNQKLATILRNLEERYFHCYQGTLRPTNAPIGIDLGTLGEELLHLAGESGLEILPEPYGVLEAAIAVDSLVQKPKVSSFVRSQSDSFWAAQRKYVRLAPDKRKGRTEPICCLLMALYSNKEIPYKLKIPSDCAILSLIHDLGLIEPSISLLSPAARAEFEFCLEYNWRAIKERDPRVSITRGDSIRQEIDAAYLRLEGALYEGRLIESKRGDGQRPDPKTPGSEPNGKESSEKPLRKPRLSMDQKIALVAIAARNNPVASKAAIARQTGIDRSDVSKIMNEEAFSQKLAEAEKQHTGVRTQAGGTDGIDHSASCETCQCPIDPEKPFVCSLCDKPISGECKTCHFTNGNKRHQDAAASMQDV